MKKCSIAFIVTVVMIFSMLPGFTFAKTADVPLETPVLQNYSSGDQSITNRWNEVKGAEKYQLYRAESKTGKYINVWLTWQTSFKDNKVKPDKTYYYKIRAYKIQNNKKAYSKFSPVTSAKACGNILNIDYKLRENNSKSSYVVAEVTNKSNQSITVNKTGFYYKNNYSDQKIDAKLYKVSNDKTVNPKYATINPGKKVSLRFKLNESVITNSKTLFGFTIKHNNRTSALWLCNSSGWSSES